ncbi:SDR family NAD(P)-dependent oxidoreductase [Ramlibacter alkalitolerans]|uniref:SDR family NAD(P)-dependent oxidoreductase n=1 Tax=Ramlibacter alkalitolerans TaxID=2039631 RepID=A0ABS1JN28_9BURK|nr:SDR family NAD(P)-dependent oxidoreductase [Ramlibacter alkalitolerans]MBL0425647.1 SDR family NAD(P)-dependent oxidoreductase [Ramlibacter alkalitolerans]
MDEPKAERPLAVVTGASSGIGYHLARLAAQHGYDLVVAADTPLADAVREFEALGANVQAVQGDLASTEGVLHLITAIGEREVDALMANAGHGLGGSFLAQDFDEVLHVINTNIVGTVHLVQHIARGMVARARGRILITGSVAGFMPGSFQAVYNGTKAFIDSFALALRNELKGTEVTISCLMPGPTDTEFFERADMSDTRVGQGRKADPAQVARLGFAAMLKGEADVVAGLKNKLEVAISKVMPAQAVAQMHRRLAEPKGQS